MRSPCSSGRSARSGRLRSHPAWTAAQLAERLRDHEHRLTELAAGQRSVTAALELSYQQLSADQQRVYRLLGLHPGPDVDSYAVAALADVTAVQAARLLDQLLDAHLLQEPTPGRYVLHDLVSAHAADTALTAAGEPDRRAALTRLFDHYRHTASMAMDTAYPYERERRPRTPPAGTPAPELRDPAQATAWLDIELPNLLAAVRYAAGHGWAAHAIDVPTTVHRHLRNRGRYSDAAALHQHSLSAARAAGNRDRGLDALLGLGEINRLRGRYEQALGDYQQALELARAAGHRPGELEALTGLGHCHRRQGRYERALDRYQRALAIARTTDHPPGELDALFGLGSLYQVQGRDEQAIDHYQRALDIARATGHRVGELNARNGLGGAYVLRGACDQAREHYQRALETARATGHRTGEICALIGLGDVCRMQGRHEQAAGHYQQVLDIAEEAGDRNWQFEARQGLGRARRAIGDPTAALAHHREALALATDPGAPADRARAHDGLAHAYHTLRDHERARHHWQHALDILTSVGADRTEDAEANTPAIRAHLASLDQRRS